MKKVGIASNGVDLAEIFEAREDHHQVADAVGIASDGKDLAELFAPRSGKKPVIKVGIESKGRDLGSLFEPRG